MDLLARGPFDRRPRRGTKGETTYVLGCVAAEGLVADTALSENRELARAAENRGLRRTGVAAGKLLACEELVRIEFL